MPTKSTLNETQPAVVSDDPSAGQNPDLTAAGRQPDADQATSSTDGITSDTERLAAERTERRRQRAASHEAPSPAGAPGESVGASVRPGQRAPWRHRGA